MKKLAINLMLFVAMCTLCIPLLSSATETLHKEVVILAVQDIDGDRRFDVLFIDQNNNLMLSVKLPPWQRHKRAFSRPYLIHHISQRNKLFSVDVIGDITPDIILRYRNRMIKFENLGGGEFRIDK